MRGCAWTLVIFRQNLVTGGALMGSAYLEAIKENTDFEGLLVTDLTSGATKLCRASPVLCTAPHPPSAALAGPSEV